MKELICTFIFSLLSIASMAQVKYFEGSLKESVAKAKSESKIVMIMASTTW